MFGRRLPSEQAPGRGTGMVMGHTAAPVSILKAAPAAVSEASFLAYPFLFLQRLFQKYAYDYF